MRRGGKKTVKNIKKVLVWKPKGDRPRVWQTDIVYLWDISLLIRDSTGLSGSYEKKIRGGVKKKRTREGAT